MTDEPLDGGATTSGLRTFVIVWLGEFISGLGRSLTNFSLGVWLLQLTGSVTHYTLLAMVGMVPNVAVLLPAGVLVDRLDRRRLMITANLADGACKVVLLVLLLGGVLKAWHVYVLVALGSPCTATVSLLLSAIVPGLVPERHLTRANGLMQASYAAGQLVPPLLAGLLLDVIGLRGVVLFDVATYAFAILALCLVRLDVRGRDRGVAGSRRPSFMQSATAGWKYVTADRHMLALLVYTGLLTFFVGFAMVLVPPMVLKLADARTLGRVLAIAGAGYALGSAVMVLSGGPRARMRGALWSGVVFGLATAVAGSSPSLRVITGACFVQFLCIPVFNSCLFAVWQARTPSEVAGRVFAVRRVATLIATCLTFAVAGPLADRVFGPLLSSGSGWNRLRELLGPGGGRELGLMLIISGAAFIVLQLCSGLSARLRDAEQNSADLPQPLEAAR